MNGALLDELAEAAHEAWLAEKLRRLHLLGLDSWPNEAGVEQLVPWAELSEEVREFDRVVVRAMYPIIRRQVRSSTLGWD